MYIFELINKIKKSRQPKQPEFVEPSLEDENNSELEDAVTCKHVFMPIDSTKTVLACAKCGYVVKNTKMKFSESDKNPFGNM